MITREILTSCSLGSLFNPLEWVNGFESYRESNHVSFTSLTPTTKTQFTPTYSHHTSFLSKINLQQIKNKRMPIIKNQDIQVQPRSKFQKHIQALSRKSDVKACLKPSVSTTAWESRCDGLIIASSSTQANPIEICRGKCKELLELGSFTSQELEQRYKAKTRTDSNVSHSPSVLNAISPFQWLIKNLYRTPEMAWRANIEA